MGGSGPPGRETGGGYCSIIVLCMAATPLLALSACTTTPIVASASSCSSLLPDEWRKGVAGADLPEGNTVGDWIAFGDAQTGKLDQANGRTRDAIGILERCEARDSEAVKRATRRKILGLF